MQQQWLGEKLAEGRRAGRVNVLLSSNEPYEYGSTKLGKLYGDLGDFGFGSDGDGQAFADELADLALPPESDGDDK